MPSVIMPPPEPVPVIAGVTDAWSLMRVFMERPKEFMKFCETYGDWLKRYEEVAKTYLGSKTIEDLNAAAEQDRAAAEKDRTDAAAALNEARLDADQMRVETSNWCAAEKAAVAKIRQTVEAAEKEIAKLRADCDRECAEARQKIEAEKAEVLGLREQTVARETAVQARIDRLKAAGIEFKE